MSQDDKPRQDDEASELAREIRSGRKFSLAEAIGRLGGKGLMKGASPVTRKRQAELELKHYLERHLRDREGALRSVLLRRVVEGQTLLDSAYEEPLAALAVVIDRYLANESLLKDFVRAVDVEWGRANLERPHFERDGQEPHPDDPYTFESVGAELSGLRQRLQDAT
jgi:hypothetical protein